MIKRHYKKLIIVALMIAAGIILEFAGLLDADRMLNIAREYADHWWLVLVLILLQVILFTFALAGSFFLWIVAPLYPPPMAAFILAAGGTIGGITAYFFSRRLTDEWIRKIEKSHTYRLLHRQDNFFSLFALRVFPAFPHALVNYSSGMLNVKLSHFISAAILGISIKSYVYANIIYNATSSASLEELMDISTYGPLILLSVITLLGVYINYRLTRRHKQPE
ncbi:MAG: VTT domain-containing protein [Gammaproteobacteria bacterium]|jgi:uncharacterized membrane protein YdjX (TVP38/TMEM64 family)|nr:VTT domain-containing protein [Gammaproteobacteria bacterium]